MTQGARETDDQTSSLSSKSSPSTEDVEWEEEGRITNSTLDDGNLNKSVREDAFKKELGGKEAKALTHGKMAACKSPVGSATYPWFRAVVSELHLEIWPEMRPPKQARVNYKDGPGTTLTLQLYLRPQRTPQDSLHWSSTAVPCEMNLPVGSME